MSEFQSNQSVDSSEQSSENTTATSTLSYNVSSAYYDPQQGNAVLTPYQ